MGADRGSAGLAASENMSQNPAQKVTAKGCAEDKGIVFPALIEHCWRPVITVYNFKRG